MRMKLLLPFAVLSVVLALGIGIVAISGGPGGTPTGVSIAQADGPPLLEANHKAGHVKVWTHHKPGTAADGNICISLNAVPAHGDHGDHTVIAGIAGSFTGFNANFVDSSDWHTNANPCDPN